jgi:hypothetical protein
LPPTLDARQRVAATSVASGAQPWPTGRSGMAG